MGVFGTAIDDRHWGGALARDVEAVGALVSRVPAGGRRASRGFFRERNRITSGLSVACVVAEAPERSGALLFADEALSQGREVFAIPANADAEAAAGSRCPAQGGRQPGHGRQRRAVRLLSPVPRAARPRRGEEGHSA